MRQDRDMMKLNFLVLRSFYCGMCIIYKYVVVKNLLGRNNGRNRCYDCQLMGDENKKLDVNKC